MSSLSAQSRAVADRFRAAWQNHPSGSGRTPTLDAFLTAETVPDPFALFQALLRTDLEERLRHGMMPSIRYYLKCFPEHADEIRKTFDRPFRMDRLGRGGMGEVYRAFDFVGRRPMAVKVIRAAGAVSTDDTDSEALQRFYAEARAAALLQHPNIVQVYKVDHEDGVPCLYMELVEGGNLAGRVRDGIRDPRQAAAIVAAVARAVHFAHEHGIVHRDLKPANVLLTTDGTPKVTDFGLAKLGDDSCGLTRTGAVMGTPDYMAPEQAEGRSKDIGPAADVWALGGILYALLTGRPPFRADPNENIQDILRKVSHSAPIAPRVLCPSVPADLEIICLKCLEKRREDRYPSARHLADDLRRYLNGETIQARPVSATGRVWRWYRKNLAVAVSLTAVALLLFTAGGLLGLVLLFNNLLQLAWGDVASKSIAVAKSDEKALREAINALQARADRDLGAARDELDSQKALQLVAEVAGLRRETQERLAKLQPPDPVFAAEHDQLWQRRWIDLRNEATRRLTRMELREVRRLTLANPLVDEIRMGAAVSPDGTWLVIGYTKDPKLRIITRESGESRVLTYPRTLPAPAMDVGAIGGPAIAVSPDGGLIAVLYPMLDHLVLIAPGGGNFRTVPLPQGLGHTSGFVGDSLRFPADDRIELEQTGLTYALRLPEEKWEAPARGPNLGPPPSGLPGPGLGVNTRRRVSSPEYFAEQDPAAGTVEVGPVGAGGQRLVVWRDPVQGAAPDAERCQDVRFSHNPKQLYLLTTKRLLLLDAETGARAEKDLAPLHPGSGSLRQALFPWRGGVALLRQTGPEQLEAVFLVGTTAELSVPKLAHSGPVKALDLAADGLLVTAAGQQVHVWQGLQQVRIHGRDRTDPGPGGFPALPHQKSLVWWGFVSGRRSRVAVEEREATAPGEPVRSVEGFVRTDVYDSETGKLLHTFPAKGAGRIFRPYNPMPFSQPLSRSPGRRFAVVVAEEDRQTATLELWSLDDCERICRLGNYALPVGGFGSGLGLIYSPGGRWLLTVQPPAPAADQNATATVEFWRLPDGQKTGSIDFPMKDRRASQLTCQFDAGETRLVLTEAAWGGQGASEGSAAWVIDPEAGKKLRELADFAKVGAGAELLVAGEHAVVRGRSPFRGVLGPGGVAPLPCSVWNLNTSKRSELGEAWDNPPTVTLSPDGRRALLHGHFKGPAGFGAVQRTSDVQLWDLTEPKLLHEESVTLGSRGDEPFGGGGRPQSTVQHEPAVACDRDHVYLNLAAKGFNNRSETIAWRWSDRAPVKVSDRGTVVLASAVEDWLLWAGNGKTHFTDRATGKTVELEGAGEFGRQPQLSPDRRTVCLAGAPGQGSGSPAVPRRGPLASGRHGFWDTTTGNFLAPLRDGHEFSDFDATGRWAVLRDQARGVVVLDLRSGQSQRLELPLDPDRPPPQGWAGWRSARRSRCAPTELDLPCRSTGPFTSGTRRPTNPWGS